MSYKNSRSMRILGKFQSVGGMGDMNDFANVCLDDASIFTPEEKKTALHRWSVRVCEDALKTRDAVSGLPFAGPSAETRSFWKQLSLMDYDDAAFNLSMRSGQLQADYEMLCRFQAWMIERWGTAPEIPQVVMTV